MTSEFPLKPIKRILKKYYKGEITTESVIFVRNVLLDTTKLLAEEAVKEFEDINRIGNDHHTASFKRLNKFTFESVFDRFFKPVFDKDDGVVGHNNKALLCQNGDITNRKKNDIIIKDEAIEVA